MSSDEEDFVLAPKAKSVSAAKPPKKAKGVGEQYQKLGQLGAHSQASRHVHRIGAESHRGRGVFFYFDFTVL